MAHHASFGAGISSALEALSTEREPDAGGQLATLWRAMTPKAPWVGFGSPGTRRQQSLPIELGTTETARRAVLGPCVAQARSAVSLRSFFCHFSNAGLGCGQLVVADYCASAYPERKAFMTRLEIMADYFQVYVCDPAFNKDWSTLWTDQTVDNRIVALPHTIVFGTGRNRPVPIGASLCAMARAG